MAHKAIDETQTVVVAKKEYPTEETIWDFININGLYEKSKKRMLIVGDSITGGIYSVINEVASRNWTVDSFTTSLPINDRDFIPTFRNALMHSRVQYDVIHFNNGGHGLETPQEFEESYREAISLMRELHPNAKIVLATCITAFVPEPDGTFLKQLESWRRPTEIRNEICRNLCSEFGFALNDLEPYSLKIKDDHLPDGIHYNKDGSRKLAFQVMKFAR